MFLSHVATYMCDHALVSVSAHTMHRYVSDHVDCVPPSTQIYALLHSDECTLILSQLPKDVSGGG